MAISTFASLDDFRAAAGTHLGRSDWLVVTQDRVGLFAEATEDRQWIHIDPERAAQGPFGTTIAHGYLTLSLLVPLLAQIVDVQGIRMAVNYGVNRVRFTAPVPIGSKLRAGAILASAEDVAGGVQATYDVTFEIEHGTKPVCVAEAIIRYYA